MVASGRHRGQRGCRDVDDDTESEYRGRLFSDSARCVDSSRAQSHPPWAVACVRRWGSIVPRLESIDAVGGVQLCVLPVGKGVQGPSGRY